MWSCARAAKLVRDQRDAPDRIGEIAHLLLASVGAPPPDGSEPARGREFDALIDGHRTRDGLGFKPQFPRLSGA